jgi:phosphate starvation-inducible PhoH-like protein
LTEKIIVIESVNPVGFFGVNNSNLKILRDAFPALKIADRGNELKILGSDADIVAFQAILIRLLKQYEKEGILTEDNIRELTGTDSSDDFSVSSTIVIGNDGLLVKPKTPNQHALVKVCSESDMVFAIGPSGTGKTYTAVALAVRALKNKQVRKIILTRPAVEAGENLGFLPGDLKEKLDPYLQPLYDALRDMIPPEKLKFYMESGTIQIAPLAYMRGRTLDNAFVILDEAQNATYTQMKMFLTRMGQNAQFVLTGDISQVDLPRNQRSGLLDAVRILKGVEGIGFVEFNQADVIRHRLVKSILSAYDRLEQSQSNSK